ncbi:MAG: hypothetical protein GKR89_17195 [Candidatus Latescibacteria bacterium]|nr:hypothetical protein [Candidatus Latescibacterota bacterium]
MAGSADKFWVAQKPWWFKGLNALAEMNQRRGTGPRLLDDQRIMEQARK